MKVLFVCTGNTCRSPMAELYTASRLHGDPRFEIASAGLAAFGGSRISASAAAVLKNLVIDPSHFRSQPVTRELLDSCDLVITVTAAHRALLCQKFPQKAPQIRLLAEFSGGNGDIPDPFGENQAVYERIFAIMRPSLDGVVEYLKRCM